MNLLNKYKNYARNFVCTLFLCAPLVSCGPHYEEGQSSQLSIAPRERITFARTQVGQSSEQSLVALSTGTKDLIINDIQWVGPNSVQVTYEAPALPITLSPGSHVPVSVHFNPTLDDPSPEGVVRFISNDIFQPQRDIPVVSQQMQPNIRTIPSKEESLFIPLTETGETTKAKVTISNTGDLPLHVSEIALQATGEFSLQYSNAPQYPFTLRANSEDTFEFYVQFSPETTGERTGTITILSNDPVNPEYLLPIRANNSSPCLLVQPQMLEYTPAVSVGSSKTKTVLLQSCSVSPLIIYSVAPASQNSVFSANITTLNTPIAFGEAAELEITYSPEKEGTDTTTYLISSNDPVSMNTTLQVVGLAAQNQCPTSSIRARVSSSSTWAKDVPAAPLDNIMLDGSQSTDPDSLIEEYLWEITKKPTDSTSTIQTNGSQASFFIDLAGEYEICLTVVDSSGVQSCNTDCTKINAVPSETLHIQLVWNTPNDKLIGDKDGTDLDLHFLQLPNGQWGDKGDPTLNNGTDVYFQNQQPVWKNSDNSLEYPSLDRDDKDGEGPENVNLDSPNPCHWYAVGAHYFEDYGFGISYATLRIYISGKLRFEKANISLKQKAEFKQIAFIFWDGNTAHIYEDLQIYTKDEDWIQKTPTLPSSILSQAQLDSPHCF